MDEGGNIRVVHLDDDRPLLEVTKLALEQVDPGLVIEPTADPEEALGLLPTVDCVVTDYVMGDVDGLAFLETVREIAPETPVIFFTGRGSEDVAAEAFALGVTDYLQKSVGDQQYAVLGNRIRTLVDHRRAKEAAAQATAQVHRIYDRIGEAYVSVDTEWRVRYLNSAAEVLLATETPFEPGTSFWRLLSDIDESGRADIERAMREQTSVAFDCYALALDRWLEIRAYPSPAGLSVYCRDVSGELLVADEGELPEELRTPNGDVVPSSEQS